MYPFYADYSLNLWNNPPPNTNPDISTENRCQIPWMRPQENFYYYDSESGNCINFPYTGACNIQNLKNGYANVFSSYDECMRSWQMPGVASTDDVLDYNIVEGKYFW